IDFRTTQHHFERYLASRGRLRVPVIPDRFAELRKRYDQELVEVRGFSGSTLRQHAATVADFLKRGLGPHRVLRSITHKDVERFVALKSQENCRQSLQHVVAAMRAFMRYCHDQGETSTR